MPKAIMFASCAAALALAACGNKADQAADASNQASQAAADAGGIATSANVAADFTNSAVAAGNATVLKPAEDACATALALCDLVEEAGFPAGAVNVVTGRGAVAGAALAAHPGVDFVSFTGSPEVGLDLDLGRAFLKKFLPPESNHLAHKTRCV